MALVGNELRRRDQLVRKRGAIKAKLTAFKSFLEQSETEPDIHSVKAHLERVGTSFSQLESFTSELQELEEDVDHYETQASMEAQYTELLAQCYKLQDAATRLTLNISDNSARSSPNPFSASLATLARLPEQALPKFSGKYEDWLGFQDDFQSTIGRRPGLSDTEKLKYLRSCLSGEPERIVRQFETTDEGYRNAWSLLKATFEDKGRIRERHVSEILSIPPMQRESAHELNQFINTMELHNSSLRSLGEDTYSTLMLCITLTKIDKVTRKQWRMTRRDGELPTYADLIAFLRRAVISTDEPLVARKDDKSRNGPQQIPPNKYVKQAQTFVTATESECNICKGQHKLYQCQEFKKLPPKKKFQAAIRASACINCLRSNHSTKQCTSSFSCRTCGKKHHTWLHFTESSPSTSEASETAQAGPSQQA